MINFADNIYLWRVFRGLSQEALALRSGIPRPNISAIESGKREASLLTVRRLSAVLGTTPGDLINGVVPPYFKDRKLTRKFLEKVIEIVLNMTEKRVGRQERYLSIMFSSIIRNRLNAEKGIYKNTIKQFRSIYITNWMVFKAVVGREVTNNLLSRLNKHLMISQKSYA